MAIVAITSRDELSASTYLRVVAGHARNRLITPSDMSAASPHTLLDGVGGLLLTGGPEMEALPSGQSTTQNGDAEDPREPGELELLGYALKRDMPVLGVCRGMQLLNLSFGGGLPRDIPGHGPELRDGKWEAVEHSIYLSPGSKLAAILGMGGFFRVNSLHRRGLREAQKSPRLLASAYSLEDGIIEGLESPDHSWAVGVQCQPERQSEMPKVFANLFVSFLERAEAYGNRA